MNYKAVGQLIKSAKSVFVIAGWGLSAPSGIPSLQFNKELWEQDPSAVLSTVMFQMRPKKVWEFVSKYKRLIAGAKINKAHIALHDLHLKLQSQHKSFHVVTHTIDGLLSRYWKNKNLIEMYGNINYMRCSKGCSHKLCDVSNDLNEIPLCSNCKNYMRPHVLLRDERKVEDFFDMEELIGKGLECDCMLIIGSQLKNFLLQELVNDHLMAKKLTININKENDGEWIKKNVVSIREVCEISLPQILDTF